MLPSLSSSGSGIKAPASRCLPIELGNGMITAGLLDSDTKSTLWTNSWPLPELSDASWSRQVAAELDRLIGNSSPEIKLVLPDPMIKHFVLKMSVLPGKPEDVEALIQWRLREDFYLDSEAYRYDYQIENSDEKSIGVFAIDKAWFEHVNDVFQAHNLLISSLTTRSMQQLADASLPDWQGFMINVQDEFVSYGLFRQGLRPQFLDSRFIDAEDREGQRQFLQRGVRELAAAKLQVSMQEERIALCLGRQELCDEFAGLLTGYSLRGI